MTHTPTPEQLQEFKDAMQKILSELNWKGAEQIMEPQFDTAMIEWYSMYEAYYQHRLNEQDNELIKKLERFIFSEGFSLDKNELWKEASSQLRKVAALQERLQELEDHYAQSNIELQQQLTEANAKYKSLYSDMKAFEELMLKEKANSAKLYIELTSANAEIEMLKGKLKHGYKMCISCDTIYWSDERCPECFPL